MDNRDTTLPAGKLPPELLASVLSTVQVNDPRVLIGPRVGTDAAAIDTGNGVLILKSDPITFATDDAGWYLVNVNANDIACMGGTPRWLMVTALLPEHATTPALVEELFSSLNRACQELNITLIGGHTEITIGLDRPILIGSMIGEATYKALIDPGKVQAGDTILLCKGIAIEGTSLLAREAAEQLATMNPVDRERAAGFLHDPGISVVAAATYLRDSGAVIRAMHDPTEGGIATALRELGAASGHSLQVDLDLIPVYPETRQICATLGLDPLGLIASGALLAIVAGEDAERALHHLMSNGVPCAAIGHITGPGNEVDAVRSGEPAELPEFEVDEIARYFAALANLNPDT